MTEPQNIFAILFTKFVLKGLLGTALFEKGHSIFENRRFSGRHVGAYMLIIFGAKQFIKLLYQNH